MKLSVIICVYNTEPKYFEECLKSIKNSTLRDYEVLVIDDGSELDYTEIIEKYKPRYVKTENRGLFAARLYALSLANGEYVTFVDSDDTVSFNYHQPMVELADKEGADIVINDWAFHTERTRYFCKWEKDWSINLEGEEILRAFAANKGRSHAYFVHWNKVTRRSLLLKVKRALEATDIIMHKHTYSEDAIINFFAFKYARKLVNTHTGYYFYRVHEEQSVNASSKDKLLKQIDNMSMTFEIMLANIEDSKYAAELEEGIIAWREMMARTHYSYAKAGKHKDVYPYIMDKYYVEKLKMSTKKDGELYAKNQLLGDNFIDIDKALSKIYYTDDDVTVIYDKNDDYVRRTLEYIEKTKAKKDGAKKKTLMVPKAIISKKNKFLHNSLIYSLGMVFFKKGSKIRAFLKAHF